MSLKTKQKYSQDVRVAEFTWNFDDTMVATDATTDDFKAVQANIFDVIELPPNSVVVGGDVVTETAIGTSTAYNVKVGDSGSDNRYLGTTDKVAAGRTALVPTGYVNTGGLSVRLTVTPTVAAATAGKATLRVEYVVRDRANEVA
jgi:hypothetical protein